MKKLMAVMVMMATIPTFAAYQFVSYGKYLGGHMIFDGATTISMNINSFTSGVAPVDFGYYMLGTTDMVSLKDATASFNPGDEIGFWLRDAGGNITSTSSLSGATWMPQGSVLENGSYTMFTGGNYPIYRYEYNYSIGEVTAPSGQPLPGVIAALAVGGGVLAVRKLRRKRA